MFKKDDIIMYGASGVCRIAGIIEKEFGGANHPYYELHPVYDQKSTVFVPLENSALVGKMHRLLSSQDIETLLTDVPKQESNWITNEPERKQHYKELLEQGDRKALMGAIQTLYHHQQSCHREGKHLHVCDERFFKDAERILYDEFAYVLNIDRDKVLNYILDKLQNATA